MTTDSMPSIQGSPILWGHRVWGTDWRAAPASHWTALVHRPTASQFQAYVFSEVSWASKTLKIFTPSGLSSATRSSLRRCLRGSSIFGQVPGLSAVCCGVSSCVLTGRELPAFTPVIPVSGPSVNMNLLRTCELGWSHYSYLPFDFLHASVKYCQKNNQVLH